MAGGGPGGASEGRGGGGGGRTDGFGGGGGGVGASRSTKAVSKRAIRSFEVDGVVGVVGGGIVETKK